MTTRSTAGPGYAFEDQVAAWLLLKMLRGEPLPGIETASGTRLQFQTRELGWELNDLLALSGSASAEQRLAISCKSNVQVTTSGLPRDLLKPPGPSGPGVMLATHAGHDRLMLATRGRHPAFQAVWTDIKDWCANPDTTLAEAQHLWYAESIAGSSTALRGRDRSRRGRSPMRKSLS